MPPRSTVKQLPKLIQARLNKQLSANGFREHQALVDWLDSQGYRISKSSVQRYSKGLQERVERAEDSALKARAIAEAFPDSDSSMGTALTGLIQQELLEFVMEGGFSPEMLTPIEIVKAIGEINRADVAHRKWQQEIQEKLQSTMETLSQDKTLDPDTLRRVTQEIYGILPNG